MTKAEFKKLVENGPVILEWSDRNEFAESRHAGWRVPGTVDS